MNKVILMGRLTRDPQITWTQGQDQKCTARFTLAVDRRMRSQEGQQTADFISCVAWKSVAEFVEKYLKQGTKILVTGRIQTGSYTNREGQKVYTTDVVVESVEFAESKGSQQTGKQEGKQPDQHPAMAPDPGFMDIPDGLDDEGLPFC